MFTGSERRSCRRGASGSRSTGAVWRSSSHAWKPCCRSMSCWCASAWRRAGATTGLWWPRACCQTAGSWSSSTRPGCPRSRSSSWLPVERAGQQDRTAGAGRVHQPRPAQARIAALVPATVYGVLTTTSGWGTLRAGTYASGSVSPRRPLVHPEGHRSSQEVTLALQLGDLALETADPGRVLARRAVPLPAVNLGLVATQPSVESYKPSSSATSAIGRPLERTTSTASRLNSGENFRRGRGAPRSSCPCLCRSSVPLP